MKQYFLKGFSLLLVLLLTASLFSACGKKAEETAAQATTEAETEEETTEDITGTGKKEAAAFPEASADELSVLGETYSSQSLVNACTDSFFLCEDPHFSADFTGNLTAEEAKNALFLGSRSPLYDFYYGKPKTVEYSEGLNPLDASVSGDRSYVMYEEKKVDAMLRDMLNMKDLTAEDLADAPGGSTKFYCQDGYLYLEETARVSGKTPYAVADEVTRLRGGRYRVTVHYALFENEKMLDLEGEGELIAGIVTAEGERHWAVFSYSAFLQRAQPEEATTAGRENGTATAETTTAQAASASSAYMMVGERADAVTKAYGNGYKEKTATAIVYEKPGMRFRLSDGRVSAVTLWGETEVYADLRADMTAAELKALDRSVVIEEYDDAAEATVSRGGYTFLYVWENYKGESDAAARVTITKG